MADDLLQGLKDALHEKNGENAESDPQATMEKLLKALESMPGLSQEEKNNFKENLASGVFGNLGSQASGLPLGGVISNPWYEFATLFGLISLISLALGLIGYKLYYNALARERKRELKKLQKEQKKKK